MKFVPISIGALLSNVQSLNVVQILDSVVLEKEEFLELRNFNEASIIG